MDSTSIKSKNKNLQTSTKETRTAPPSGSRAKGARFEPYFVPRGEDPYKQVKWVRRSSKIAGTDGQSVFAMEAVEVPESWSQLATDIAVSKYFRKAGVPKTGHETSVRQLVHRVAHTIRTAGEKAGGYFASADDADQFERELVHLLLNQKAAFNSPVWFNCGLFHEYGVLGSGGGWRWDETLGRPVQTLNSYENPQCSACFIQSVDDDLMSIFQLAQNEARIFKYGSGTGTNFSKIRGAMEKLSGGGLSSGLMSFLTVLDRGAGATKSGGTTRRAAKMVSLDMDHPEIVDFISWKMREEKKVAALVEAGYSSDFNGEAYATVAGQNSNNSVRIPDEFMEAVQRDGEWQTTARTDGAVINTYKARELWDQIALAAWSCADPGVQFDTTIQKWHTAVNTGRINGSNPCSEYMFLDDSACNLSSLNLVKFMGEDGAFDLAGYRHACRVMFTAQEILVGFSSYPTERIAQHSYEFRPLGLGYANLGTLLMIRGIPYDSPEALAWTGALTAIMHGEAYRTSAEIAENIGPFAGYAINAEPMMRVMRQHQAALDGIHKDAVPKEFLKEAYAVWKDVIDLGSKHGFRNAQATVLAPTGTIGLLMDCDTTGIEPDFALVKFKKLAGGGYFKIVNQSVTKALKTLGYTEKQMSEIVEYAVGTMSLENSPHINKESLSRKGLTEVDFAKIASALPGAFDLHSAISPWTLGDEGLGRIGLTRDELQGVTVLSALGFSDEQVRQASRVICGRMTLEGAPHLRAEHLPVFDCANRCGAEGERFIAPMAHVKMMAAAQPFLSGAISKTVNMPHESTIEDIKELYEESWRLGLKAVAIYRDGSKMSQPLSGQNEKKKSKATTGETTDAVAPAVNASGEALMYSQKDLEEAVARAVALAPARKRRMPQKRNGLTIESRVGGHQIYLRSGQYDDGRLGEIFIDMHKEGATLRSLLNCFAISVSMGLQYGVPLEDYVDKFTFTRFEPQGLVDHPNIKSATSILDYIFRLLGMEYLGKTDFVHVKPAAEDLAVNQRPMDSGGELAARKPNVEPGQLNLPMEKAALPVAQLETLAGENRLALESRSGDANALRPPTLDPLNAQLSKLMGDAPMCSTCGHVTVRNGSCYRCLNCGNSMGCS
ncbi:MAG: vitamin B12-dependent ribonucleotide reductase [Bdellovibrionaceae bacterium]|nr:vitamin B12-dependent ribonucleotide reductase [Pseudobdellovibrionaceae bacterium]